MGALVPRQHVGELYPPGTTVCVIGRPYPFAERTIRAELPSGSTVAELLAGALDGNRSALRLEYHVAVDGCPVPPEWRHRVRVKPGHIVTFAPRLKNGDIANDVALLAVSAIAVFAAPAIAGVFFTAGSTGFAIASGLIGASLVTAGTPLTPARLWSAAP